MTNNTQDSILAAALFIPLNACSGAAKTTLTAADTQNRFLRLLVTQMKNQDMLNPMNNAQAASQMAQPSMLTNSDKLNAALQALSDSMTLKQLL